MKSKLRTELYQAVRPNFTAYNSTSGYCLDCVCILIEKYENKNYIIK